MKKRETSIMREIQLEATKLGARLWRNNVGLFFTSYGAPTKCGLCTGSSDLIGITRDGRFLAVEVKTARGAASRYQLEFIAMVRGMGGVAFVARSAEDFRTKLELHRLSAKCR